MRLRPDAHSLHCQWPDHLLLLLLLLCTRSAFWCQVRMFSQRWSPDVWAPVHQLAKEVKRRKGKIIFFLQGGGEWNLEVTYSQKGQREPQATWTVTLELLLLINLIVNEIWQNFHKARSRLLPAACHLLAGVTFYQQGLRNKNMATKWEYNPFIPSVRDRGVWVGMQWRLEGISPRRYLKMNRFSDRELPSTTWIVQNLYLNKNWSCWTFYRSVKKVLTLLQDVFFLYYQYKGINKTVIEALQSACIRVNLDCSVIPEEEMK